MRDPFERAVTKIGDFIIVSRFCTRTEKPYHVQFISREFTTWMKHPRRESLPMLSDEQYEFLIDNITPGEREAHGDL